MSFKIRKLNLDAGQARIQERLNTLLKQIEKKTNLLQLVNKIVNPSDLSYLAESILLARPSLAGELIYDHVTFYVDDISRSPSFVSSADKEIVQDAVEYLVDSFNYVKDSSASRSDILKVRKLFKGVNESVTLDYVYINIAGNTTILRQPIKGVKGTVKTALGVDDKTITFTGKIIGSNKLVYDVDTLRKLNVFAESGKVVKVDSIYLNRIWGIDKLVIESVQIEQSQELGQGNMVNFTIVAYSDNHIPIVKETNFKL